VFQHAGFQITIADGHSSAWTEHHIAKGAAVFRQGLLGFGATIEVEDEEGVRATYRIVGEDEIDLSKGHVSWRSPIGRSLLKKKPGDTVVLRRPNGEVELTLVSVRY